MCSALRSQRWCGYVYETRIGEWAIFTAAIVDGHNQPSLAVSTGELIRKRFLMLNDALNGKMELNKKGVIKLYKRFIAMVVS